MSTRRTRLPGPSHPDPDFRLPHLKAQAQLLPCKDAPGMRLLLGKKTVSGRMPFGIWVICFETERKAGTRVPRFLQQCKRHGFTRVDKALVHGLDWQGRSLAIQRWSLLVEQIPEKLRSC